MKEILKNLVETTLLPEDEYLTQDAEILDIFVEELEEIFEELNAIFPQWLSNPDDPEILATVRRHFHTLKGSGRMVGAKVAGELAWAVEDTLNRIKSGAIPLTSTVQQYAKAALNIFQYTLYPSFKQVASLTIDVRPLVLLGQQLQKQQSLEPALEELLSLADTLTAEGQLTGLEWTSAEEMGAAGVHTDVIDEPTEVSAETADAHFAASDVEETLAIFLEEAEEHLATITKFLSNTDEKTQDYNGLIRALHTLRGSSSMAHIDEIFDASSKVENLFKTLVQDEISSSSKETGLLQQYVEFVSDYLHILPQGNTEKLHQIYQTFDRIWNDYGFANDESNAVLQPQGIVSKLIELNIDLLLDAEFEFDSRIQDEYPDYVEILSQQAAELLQHTDNRASQGIYDFTADLKLAYDALIAKPQLLSGNYVYELFAQAHQEFIHLFDTLAAGQRVILTEETQKLLSELVAYIQQDIEIFAESVAEQAIDTDEKQDVSDVSEIAPSVEIPTAAGVDFAALSQRIASDRAQQDAPDANRDFDGDLVDIFLEEADELLVGIDQDLNTWSKNHADTTSLNNLMRYLHTLKGGANMIAASHIGSIAHELESIYERVIRKQIPVTSTLIQIIRLVQDNISDRIQSIRDDLVDYPAPAAIDILQNIQGIVYGQSTVQVVALEQTMSEVVAEAEVASITPDASINFGHYVDQTID